MRIRTAITMLMLSAAGYPAWAMESHPADAHPNFFHMFRLETETGKSADGSVSNWDFDGWLGSDYDKLWLKSEGELDQGDASKLETWALYSRNVATYWDVQGGIRYDNEPRPTAYAVFGVQGLAPYFFETEAHVFLSNRGNLSARLRQENDFLITQRLILQPYVETTLYAQNDRDQEIGNGYGNAEFGLQTRYEFTRKFAPYVNMHYERKFGPDAKSPNAGEYGNDGFVFSAGLRLMF